MHLWCLSRMLNVLAASGHHQYAKSARLHLQTMLELPEKFPLIHSLFIKDGFHTVRRSDRFWARLWSDLIIEQCLMRSLQSRGGLTRGRRVTESVRQIWVRRFKIHIDLYSIICISNVFYTLLTIPKK